MAMFVLLDYGVLPSSVLGPVLFLLFTSDLVELVWNFGLPAHAYAADLQVLTHECWFWTGYAAYAAAI